MNCDRINIQTLADRLDYVHSLEHILPQITRGWLHIHFWNDELVMKVTLLGFSIATVETGLVV